MLLAAGGFRAVEALSIRIKDLDLESRPARVLVRGEYTKTKIDTIAFLTEEVAGQLNSWLGYKYRTRRVSYTDQKTLRIVTEHRTPERNVTDLIFAVYQQSPDPNRLYDDFCRSFAKDFGSYG